MQREIRVIQDGAPAQMSKFVQLWQIDGLRKMETTVSQRVHLIIILLNFHRWHHVKNQLHQDAEVCD